jgi:hypothetical protein
MGADFGGKTEYEHRGVDAMPQKDSRAAAAEPGGGLPSNIVEFHDLSTCPAGNPLDTNAMLQVRHAAEW